MGQVDSAAAAAEWNDAAGLAVLAADARTDLEMAHDLVTDDPAVAAVGRARVAVAEAVLAVARHHSHAADSAMGTSMRRAAVLRVARPLGVANVLSVVYPLRHEPVSARIHDGTWQPNLFSFAVSYGIGLTVNLMI
ncbi:MAG: hypothetical protein ACSLE6_20500 [Mycobacterium sp.]